MAKTAQIEWAHAEGDDLELCLYPYDAGWRVAWHARTTDTWEKDSTTWYWTRAAAKLDFTHLCKRYQLRSGRSRVARLDREEAEEEARLNSDDLLMIKAGRGHEGFYSKS